MRYASPLVLLAAALLAACDGGVGPEAQQTVASVVVSPSRATLVVADTQRLAATLRSSGGTVVTGGPVSWRSSDSLVAQVSATGLVTARAAGSVRIIAVGEGKSGEAQITVVSPAVVRVELEQRAPSLEEGQALQLVATPLDAQGRPIDGLGIRWTSSAPDVVAVDPLGTITGIRGGHATVTAAVHGVEASEEVTVATDYAYDLLFTETTPSGHSELFRVAIGRPTAVAGRPFPAERWVANPAPSPDGSRVAYVCRSAFGDPALCTADLDGSDESVLLSGAGEPIGEPSWSPDGTRLAYVRKDAEGMSRIWVIGVDGTGATPLTESMEGQQSGPSWSAASDDGRHRITFASGTDSQHHIWTMRDDGSDRQRITDGDVMDSHPVWSPDGESIAFQRLSYLTLGDLWVIDAEGGQERPLGQTRPGNQHSPAWSPDGRLVAFVSEHESYGTGAAEFEIYTVWSDGSKLARRTFDAGDRASPAWVLR